MHGSSPRPRIDSLDSLRGLCALSVVLFHFNTAGALTNTAFIRHSWLLVDFFFVLSGFVITAAYADELRQGLSIPRYLFLRLARIWPLHLVMLLCFVALELSKLVVQVGPYSPLFAPPREVGSFFLNLGLLQVFGIYNHVTWNVPSWSIAAEVWVYALSAIIFRLVGSGRTMLFITIAGLCALVMTLSGEPFLNLTYDGAVVRCLYGFSIGVLAQAAFSRGKARVESYFANLSSKVAWSTIAEAGVVAAAVTAVCLVGGGAIAVAVPLVFGLCVLVLAHQGGLVTTLLSHKVPVWLGSISYSIYMTHLFVEGRLLDLLAIAGRLLDVTTVERIVVDGAAKRIVVGSELFITATIVVLLATIIAVSQASYRFIEQPGNTWARARVRHVKRPEAMVPAS